MLITIFVNPFIFNKTKYCKLQQYDQVCNAGQNIFLPTAFALKVPSLLQFLSPLRQSKEQRRQVRDGDLLTLCNVHNTVNIHLKVLPDDTSGIFLT